MQCTAALITWMPPWPSGHSISKTSRACSTRCEHATKKTTVVYQECVSGGLCLGISRSLPESTVGCHSRGGPKGSGRHLRQPTSAPTTSLIYYSEHRENAPTASTKTIQTPWKMMALDSGPPLALDICSSFHMRLVLSLGPAYWLSSALLPCADERRESGVV